MRVLTANGTWLTFIGRTLAPIKVNDQSTIHVELWIRDDQIAESLVLGRDAIKLINKVQGDLRITFDGNVRKAGLKSDLETTGYALKSYKPTQQTRGTVRIPARPRPFQ